MKMLLIENGRFDSYPEMIKQNTEKELVVLNLDEVLYAKPVSKVCLLIFIKEVSKPVEISFKNSKTMKNFLQHFLISEAVFCPLCGH